MLPGFDDLVQDMDIGLLDSKAGFGTVIRIIGDATVEVDALVVDPEPSDRMQSSHDRARGIRVKRGILLEVRTADIPDQHQEHIVRLDFGGPDYHIADVEPIDSGMSLLSLVPHKNGAPSNGSWLRDEN